MHANDTNPQDKIVHKELSYVLNGIFFEIQNEHGRYCREKQYADVLEQKLKNHSLHFKREAPLPIKDIESPFTNKVDFDIEGRVLVDIKAKPTVTKEDYYQMNRYLEACGYKLGMIVNFRNRYLKPIRVIRANS